MVIMHRYLRFLLTGFMIWGGAALADALTDANALITEVKARVPGIHTAELKRMIAEDQEFVLLDVRTPSEIEELGRIDAPQLVEIPRGWLEMRIFDEVLDVETPIVVYCGGGPRSAFATDTLMQLGFTDVRAYREGFFGWEAAGNPVKK